MEKRNSPNAILPSRSRTIYTAYNDTFSSDDSDDSDDYTPVKKPIPVRRNCDTNVDGDECSDSDTQSEEVAIQGDVIALLDRLLKMVRPCAGRGRDVRKLVQNLKKSFRTLQNQVNSAHNSCPDADNTPCAEAKAWACTPEHACRLCGMNHLVYAIIKAGCQIYGTTAAIRKERMSGWMQHGCAPYHALVQAQVHDTWLGSFLKTITTRNKVIKKARRHYEPKAEQQVSRTP